MCCFYSNFLRYSNSNNKRPRSGAYYSRKFYPGVYYEYLTKGVKAPREIPRRLIIFEGTVYYLFNRTFWPFTM